MSKREELKRLKQKQELEKESVPNVPNPIEKMLPPEPEQEHIKGQIDIDELEDGKYKPSSGEKAVVRGEQKNVEKEQNIDVPITKYGKKDKRYKAVKLDKKYPLSLEQSLYDDLEVVAYVQKKSVNILINEILKNGLDQEEVARCRKIVEQFK